MRFDLEDLENFGGKASKKAGGFFTKGKLAIGLVLILVLILVYSVTHSVSPGHIGVVNNKMSGGIQETTLGQGWNLVAPWSSVTEYPISTEVAYYTGGSHEGRKTDDSIVIGTKDGKTMKVDAQVTYHMERKDLPHVYNKFKGADSESIEYGYMRQNFQRIANDLSSQYSMMDIVGEKKAEFNSRLFQLVSDFFDADGIYVEQAGLGKVEPDDATKQAIQAVANAQYAQRQAEYEKLAAEAEAKTKVAKAQGDADATRISADATAYVNTKLQQTVTQDIVALKWIEKWNGQLPTTTFGSGQNFMVNLK